METRSAAGRGSGTKVARASVPPNTPSLEKNSAAEATNKPVKRPVSIAARKIRPLIRTDSVCHPSPEGVVGVSDALGVDTRRRSAESESTDTSVGFEKFRLLRVELRFGQDS